MSAAQKRRVLDRSRSEEHTSELQSRRDLVCRLLLEKKKITDQDWVFLHLGFKSKFAVGRKNLLIIVGCGRSLSRSHGCWSTVVCVFIVLGHVACAQ